MLNKPQEVVANKKRENTIVLEGHISKFINKHHNLVKRYLVLNKCGMFVYKDEIAFRSFPYKPSIIIPLGEVAKINQREFSAQQMLRSSNTSALKGNEYVYVMEITLKQNYSRI